MLDLDVKACCRPKELQRKMQVCIVCSRAVTNGSPTKDKLPTDVCDLHESGMKTCDSKFLRSTNFKLFLLLLEKEDK